jgi:hypothetical protein
MQISQPLLLRLEFAYPLENANHVIGPLITSLKRKMFKCGHTKHGITLIVVTEESSRELVKRLGLDDNSSVIDYHCHVAPIGAITKHGGISPFYDALDKAWNAVGQRRNPEYVRQTKRFDPRIERRVKDPERGAVREMIVKVSGAGKPPQYPDRK